MLRDRMPGRLVHVAFAALIATLAGAAQAPEVPHPAPEIERITALAGTFEGAAAVTADGKTVRFTLHHVNHRIAGGFGLAVHEEAEVPGMGHFEAENLFGWDTDRRQLHLYSVTTDPVTHDHFGAWKDQTHVTLRAEGTREGRRMVEEIPLEVVSPDEYRFRSTVTVPGRSPEVFEATMKRVN